MKSMQRGDPMLTSFKGIFPVKIKFKTEELDEIASIYSFLLELGYKYECKNANLFLKARQNLVCK